MKNILNGRLRCQAATFVSLFINRVAVGDVGLPIKDYYVLQNNKCLSLRGMLTPLICKINKKNGMNI